MRTSLGAFQRHLPASGGRLPRSGRMKRRGTLYARDKFPESRSSRKEREMSTPPSPSNDNRTTASFVALGVGVGVALGAAIGVALDQITVGVGFGVGIGAALGLALQMSQRTRSGD